MVSSFFTYELLRGNAVWRFGLFLLLVLLVTAFGRVCQFLIARYNAKIEQRLGTNILSLMLRCISRPVSVAVFALGMYLCKLPFVFGENGINPDIEGLWLKMAQTVAAISVGYAMYRLVAAVEYYLKRTIGHKQTEMDNMLIPVIRKSLRLAIVVIAALYIADGILGAQIKTILFSAGIGGIAVAFAAKETIANFFGSITIFADRPFQVSDLVRIGDCMGPVEEVGFRSTRVRTLDGHLVTIPNGTIANSNIENLSRRPSIRRTANIGITYDSGAAKTHQAAAIIKEILSQVPEINSDPATLPRVYFSEFNDCSLNILVVYWVKPADYWVFQGVNERVNFEILKRFGAEKIEFAFPTQTLYVKKEGQE